MPPSRISHYALPGRPWALHSVVAGLQKLLDNNRNWSRKCVESDPFFFDRLVSLQRPKYLWIGCSDSRVPANEVIGLAPGEVFVHRNVANLVVNTDMNCLSVVQYAVEELKVEDIVVCGHYGCGGVLAALDDRQHGLIDNWLRHIKDVHWLHRDELNQISDVKALGRRLCELNVLEQVANLCHTTIVQNAWYLGQPLAVHGVIYDLADGILHDLAASVLGVSQLNDMYRMPRK